MSGEEPGQPSAATYMLCPACKELWRADWMQRQGVTSCPSCDVPVVEVLAVRPYRVIVADAANPTPAQRRESQYATILHAANAFVNAHEPYREVIYDDGREARELNEREHQLFQRMCWLLGYEA